MNKTTRKFVFLVLVLAVALPITSFADHSWGGYHWARTANPFTLKVHDNVTSVWDGHLDVAISDWSASTVLDLVKQNNALSNVKRCSSASGRIEVCNSTYGQTGWLGIAGISITGGTHITKGYTKLNDTYFNTPQYNTSAWRAMVTCQELGHDFGLDHQDENFDNANLGTCMDYTNNPSSNQHPNTHDFQQISTIYAHLDSTTTISSAIEVMGKSLARPWTIEEMLADAGQWGAPIRFDPYGRPNVFILHLGHDQTEITHVFWAPTDPFAKDNNQPGTGRSAE